jgi:hypothetical protein
LTNLDEVIHEMGIAAPETGTELLLNRSDLCHRRFGLAQTLTQ